ncbi:MULTISPECIES: hypothetical protein [Flavobacterium]|uniref:Uncharacterized protein n=2 Tax=Flavobacterium TaxID=237 RepID=A0A7W7IW36_9FLAO|nr:MULTISPECIES: hypothetical protein [Flavobacterium]MBB4801666.1 hypothetical protein [Flavobacterium nitrogenifigens]MBB6386624.1 hypothetical protein [Flavobacterium notoginsengisoli]
MAIGAAKMQFFPTVGNAFLRSIGTITLPKCAVSQIPLFTFYQTDCKILGGIFIIPFFVLANFFSFNICDQRKEAKERRLIRYGF